MMPCTACFGQFFHLLLDEIEIFRSSDSYFYDTPRFVTHIDDPAIAALTKYYSEVLPPSNTPGVAVLDMCSSWVRQVLPSFTHFVEHNLMS